MSTKQLGNTKCGFLFLLALRPLLELSALPPDSKDLIADHFSYKNVKHICYFSCETTYKNAALVKHLNNENMSVSVRLSQAKLRFDSFLSQWYTAVGVLVDGACGVEDILYRASISRFFDAMHVWLVLTNELNSETNEFIEKTFSQLNLSIDADVVVATWKGNHYDLTDVFNFGKLQNNPIEKKHLGTWSNITRLHVAQSTFKYYDRWNFHNLTLRAVTVIRENPKHFEPELISRVEYTPGVTAMTKISSELLNILKNQHNFRFNYTIVDRWVGKPVRNTSLAVTNSMHWRLQDISSTSVRFVPKWIVWMDHFTPPTTHLETKVYYLIPDKGVGDYENRFLTPLSVGAWLGGIAAMVGGGVLLTLAATAERHPAPAQFALYTVLAAVCQQAYEDGVKVLNRPFTSQSGRMTMLVTGASSLILYNYYTSSVVSWLLRAAPPSIAGIDGLIRSNFELVFEDQGYTWSWFDNPGFFYFSGFKNPKEDELRNTKVLHGQRTVPLIMPIEQAIELMRSGAYAYHAEPGTAWRVAASRLTERELCSLGSVQLMPPSHVYIVGQKRSPYKQFFDWSLMRLAERGHRSAARARAAPLTGGCSGKLPRALALGQAAPALVMLIGLILLSVLLLLLEILHHRLNTVSFKRRHKKRSHEAWRDARHDDGGT